MCLDAWIHTVHVYMRTGVYVHTYVCNTVTPHIKASSHATYIYDVALSRCATTSNGMWYNFHWNADNFVIYTLTHNALSYSSNWLHIRSKYKFSIVGEMLG